MPLDFKNGKIDMAHGSGGRATQQLIDELFIPAFANAPLDAQADFASVNAEPGRLITATDSHVISPLFFPGGDIGSLAVNGTVNDVAMSGARPKYLTAAFIIEAGFPLNSLQKIVQSMARAAQKAQVQIIAGDTKVVDKGQADGVFINTTGFGFIGENKTLSPTRIRPGDTILINGTMGDHGVAILSAREDSPMQSNIESDCQSLAGLIESMVTASPNLHCLRDPTRGGLAAALNELAHTAKVGMHIEENAIPIHPSVNACTELLGLDPLYIANEGKVIAFCPPQEAYNLLDVMRTHPMGKQAAIIGAVCEDNNYLVETSTPMGGKRILDWRYSDPLPRIC